MHEQSLFIEALEKEDPAERAAFLERACAGDPALRQRLERLLARHQEGTGFLESPAAPPLLPHQPAVAADLQHGPDAPASATYLEPVREGPGTVIGSYKLLEQIGEGGFGVVFQAEQQQPIRRKVALKVLKPGMDTRLVVARFEAERQALALMDHPNIAHVFDGGETASGRPYFVMELVKGIAITTYCDQSQLSPRQRLELFLSVCRAVQHAHQKGIIHRDLKPSNVLVTLHDGVPVVKIIDFGIAKATGQQLTDRTLFTGVAQLLGTPLYMSPEQAALSGLDVDTRSDIYSLGVLLYELLTGTTPFDQQRIREAAYEEMRRIICEEEPVRPSTRIITLGQATTLWAQRHSDPRRLSQLLKGELDWIVMKCLEKDRNRRYESASALGRDIQRYLQDEPVQACPPSRWYRLRKVLRKHRGAAVTAAAFVGLLLAGVAVSTWLAIRATQAEGDALDGWAEAQRKASAATEAQQKADADRKRAESAKTEAKNEAAKAEAINQFLVRNILTFSPPGRFGYRESATTVVQALEEAARDVETAFRGQPELEASVRLTIGNTFFLMGRFKEAALHLRRGLDLRGDLLSSSADPWGRAYAETAFATKKLGLALKALGRTDEAEPLLRRGGEARRRIEIRRIPFTVNAWPFTLHPGPAVLSPDSCWLLIAGDDDFLRLYDVATGIEVHRFRPATQLGVVAAFSSDGRSIITSGNKGLQLWDVNTLKQLREFKGHTDVVYFVAFSPNGRHALSAGADKTLRLWDVESGEEMRRFLGHRDAIRHAALSPDGRRILSASQDGTIRLWEVETGVEVSCFPKTWAVVGTVAYSPDGQRALSTHDDGLRLWDVKAGEELRRIPDATALMGAAFTPDGRHAVSSGDTKGKWCLWDLDTGKEVRSYYVEPPLLPKGVEVSRDGRLAVCGNWRGSISIWRMGDPPPFGQELTEARRRCDWTRRDLGPDALESLQALDELAALHLDRGEPAGAEPLFRQSLERKLRIFGAEHPATLAARRNLAHVLQAQRKPEAVAVFRQCLDVYRRLQGPECADVMVAMNDLADALEAQGQHDEAEVLCWQCLQGWDRLLGVKHTETRAVVNKLVSKLRSRGKPVEVEPAGPAAGFVCARLGQWDKALVGVARAFELGLPKDRELWLAYAALQVQTGDKEGYRRFCDRLLERFEQSKDEDEIAVVAHILVLAPHALADPGPILELAQRRKASARPASPHYSWSSNVLGLAYYRAGRFDKAAECLRRLLKPSPDGEHDVANWLLAAMAEQRLGHDQTAQKWLYKADQWIEEETLRRSQAESFPTKEPSPWPHWLIVQILHREAAGLVRSKLPGRTENGR
jgi:serine/threonine protein kinase